MSKRFDQSGQRYGRLLVIGEVPKEDRRDPHIQEWFCECDCGGLTIKRNSEKKKAHCGQCLSPKKLTGNSWKSMVARCTDPCAINYPSYGGRGVTVCERWLGPDGYKNFTEDMGERPLWATGGIDRIDPFGNYEPENCRWATKSEQQQNRRKVAA